MPAGEYWVQCASDQDRGLHLIRRTDSSANALALTLAVDAKDGKSEPVLMFHKYGNSYFLSEIWTGESQGRRLFKSEREKELARESTGTDIAVLLHSVPERGL
jgi:hypothetical protein